MAAAIASTLGLALFNAGATLAVVNAATFAAYWATTAALVVGPSLIAGALRQNPAAIKPSNGQITFRNPVDVRVRSFGRVRVSGKLFFYDADQLAGVLYHGVALNHGRIGGFVEYIIDGNIVTLSGSTIQEAPYVTLSVRQILRHTGLATETEYTGIETDFGVSEMRGDGVASALVRLSGFSDAETHYRNFPGGKPDIKFTINGSVVWDWRNGAQSRSDPTTWAFSENPVVCLLSYMLDPDGYAIPWSRIEPNLAAWTEAANVCDEQVTLAAGGTEARYRVAMTYALTDPPKDVVARLLSTFDGRCWVRRDGTIGILAGRYYAPTVTIRSEDIVSYEITTGQDPLAAVAGIRAQYMSPTHDYREQDAEPWPNAATVVALGEDRTAALDLTAVPSHGQARRLMKRDYLRRTSPFRGTVQTTLAGLRALDERFINLEIVESGVTVFSGPVEVEGFRLDVTRMGCEIEFLALGSEIDAWEPATEEGNAPTSTSTVGYWKWIQKAEGIRRGNMTSGGGLAAAFDDVRAQNLNQSANIGGTAGWVGKSWTTKKRFAKAIVYGSQNEGFSNANVSVTINIRGKNGGVPSSRTDGTIIGTITFTDTGNESAGKTIFSTDTVTGWDHIFVDIEAVSGVVCISEIDWWEAA